MNAPLPEVLKQHLIDPEICIRCNTCEESCPVDAITHDSNNYVVDPGKCSFCMACVPPCPTGAIDNWRTVLRLEAYSVEEQFTWDELPAEKALGLNVETPAEAAGPQVQAQAQEMPLAEAVAGAQVPPWSASHPYVNLYTHKNPVTATVAGNYRVTELGTDSDTHHIVLDFGNVPFPVLEGQSLGILPPGVDANGRPHHARQYSIASPRDGERPGYNNVSLTVKRVTADYQGRPVRGVASNYLCDLKKGDQVQVIGPFGSTFLMPNHPGSHLVMICTGTGSAPMRAMTERRRRRRGRGEGGKLMLFFGARTQQELPYFGPLMNLPKDFIDINFAFSRTPGQPRRYVQDVMRERAADLALLLRDPNTCFYVCGLKGMEAGVLEVLHDVATQHDLDWPALHQQLKREGRLHLETY
ncbi:benzoyl-CoA 2,3-epoxidase subunit BoxA [uncultured Azohydromonas sp.]|jgi:benzoyl-CoA oxygenase/reductase, BoxA protein|uniref:benzoyl-CoA 2,3-epoxidase subunit BoxA n=1 Tax=uncultured Azohydromonas sp. TaxID=487342 RepID=UPI00262F1E7D|nr:benzoyl-CoA 2,3-epoxidase subunit BoxA [uncultured Azohydromonas sp.]